MSTAHSQPVARPSAPRLAAAPYSLPDARAAFVAAIRRDTPGTDLPRYVAVLDALLAWTAARAPHLVLRPETRAGDGLRCTGPGSSAVFWAARPRRGAAPTLDIGPAVGGPSTPAWRADAVATLNAHSRAVLGDGVRLRIGFGALKNAAARAAVLALLDALLDELHAARGRPRPAPGAR